MTDGMLPIDTWLETFRRAADDLARISLRFDPRPLPSEPSDGSRPGAYIAILGEQDSVHLGLTAAPEHCRALARGLLGLRHEEPLGDKDVIDGVSEVMNILAGKVKSQMGGRDGQLRLGLPMFIAVPITPTGDMEHVSAAIAIGPVPVELRVYRRRFATPGRAAA
jgi:hypothetical protein